MNWIKEAFKPKTKPEGWVTVSDIMKEVPDSRHTINERLREMVKAGELESMYCIENGSRVKCYRKKKRK